MTPAFKSKHQKKPTHNINTSEKQLNKILFLGRYVGSRPIKLRKSMWKNRSLEVAKKKEKEKAALISLLTGQSS